MRETSLGPDDVAPLLTELGRALRARRFYPPTHPALREALERSTAIWRQGMQQGQELHLELRNGSFVLPCGTPVRGSGIDEVAAELRVRGIRRLRVHRDLEPEELLALIDALAMSVEELAEAGGLEQLLTRAGARHITTSEMDFAEHLRHVREPAPAAAPEGLAFGAAHEFIEDVVRAAAADEDADAAEPHRADLIGELTAMLKELEGCEEPGDYYRICNRIDEQVSRMVLAKHVLDAYRAVRVFCRHAGEGSGRPAEIRREAQSRLRTLLGDRAMLNLVTGLACSGEGLSSVQATQVLITLGAAAVPRLLELSEHGTAVEQSQVTAILIAMGDSALPAIMEELESPIPDRVRRTIRLLGRTQNPRGVDCLLDRLLDDDPEMQREVARALARIGTGRAVKGLVEAARRCPELAELVASSLGDTRSPAALQALIGMLDRRARYPTAVKRAAIRSLGRMRSPHALAVLRQVLERRSLLFFRARKNRELRVAAAQAIGKIGGDEATLVLSAHARSGDPEVARVCRESLERLASSTAR